MVEQQSIHQEILLLDLEETLELTREEYGFIQQYRKLTNEERESIRFVVRNYLKHQRE